MVTIDLVCLNMYAPNFVSRKFVVKKKLLAKI